MFFENSIRIRCKLLLCERFIRKNTAQENARYDKLNSPPFFICKLVVPGQLGKEVKMNMINVGHFKPFLDHFNLKGYKINLASFLPFPRKNSSPTQQTYNNLLQETTQKRWRAIPMRTSYVISFLTLFLKNVLKLLSRQLVRYILSLHFCRLSFV